jgi:hypothetical protein
VQDVAFVVFQLSIDAAPLTRLDGSALTLTVGGGTTVTVAEPWPDPPPPVQVSVYDDVAVTAPVDAVPLVGCAPDQAPDPVQAVAPVVVQLSAADAPLAMLDGRALSVTVGAGTAGADPPPEQAARASDVRAKAAAVSRVGRIGGLRSARCA